MTGQRRHESPEIGAMIGRMLNALIRRAAEGDWEALEALAQVEALAPLATTAALCEARETYSLGDLAKVLGVSRPAIAQRTRREWHGPAEGCGHAGCLGMRRCRE